LFPSSDASKSRCGGTLSQRVVSVVALGFVAVCGVGLAIRYEAVRNRRRREELEAVDAWAPEQSEQLADRGNSETVEVVAASEEAQATQTSEVARVEASIPQITTDIATERVPAPAESDPMAGIAVPPPSQGTRERLMGLRTLLASLQGCDRVCPESIMGPFQMNAGTDEEVPVVCFQFRMSHFTCKAYLAHGTQDEGSQHLKLQTTFEDNRRSLGEEQRYFIANEWNATKRYTRLKCGYGGAGRSSVFTLEYDVLVPAETPHTWGLLLLSQTLRMWYTSMVACVMHIVEPRDVPFATHEMITANTLSVSVREEDECLLQQSCPICFENFRVGEKVRRLPCMHLFHVVGADAEQSQGQHCNIDRHLVRDKQCPVCKTPVDFMERIDKNSLSVKMVEGEALVLPDSNETTGSSGARNSQEAFSNATTEVTHAVSDTASTLAGLAQAAADAVRMTVPSALSNGSEGEVLRQPLPGVVPATTGQSMTAVARGAAVQGIQAAAEVAAAAARMAPSVQQDGNNGQTAGLPAQAAELERAVRSLQSRWMQIQDVVAGMQQMLQYIEESQSMMSAARTEQQAIEAPSGEALEVSTNAVLPTASEETVVAPNETQNTLVWTSEEAEEIPAPTQRTQDEEVQERHLDVAQPPQLESSPSQQRAEDEELQERHTDVEELQERHTQTQQRVEDTLTVAVEEEVEEVSATLQTQEQGQDRETSIVPSPSESSEAQRRIEEVPPETSDTRAAQASMMSGLLQATLQAMRGRNLPVPPSPATVPEMPQVPQATPPPSQGDRWQPFTEAEKVCMAYMWRWRRANLTGSTASNATAENSRSDSNAPS